MKIYPGAIMEPGHPAKVGYGDHRYSIKKGAVIHSMEGWTPAAINMLKDPAQAVSWHFSITKSGAVYQHYDPDLITWHGGGLRANELFVGIEVEGQAPEPLTDRQYDALAELLKWLAAQYGWPTWDRQVTLWEHRELGRFGSPPTACPSDRIDWQRLIDRLHDTTRLPRELWEMPVGWFGPVEALVLEGGKWVRRPLHSYHEAIVGLFEGWVRPIPIKDESWRE
jgi:Negative regulator of beta-lactamase expression